MTDLEKRAYTILVSVQPAIHREVMRSSNETILRLNLLLEDFIAEWVAAYITASEDGCEDGT